MAIHITKQGERVPVGTINVLIYGQPSTGKTSVCYTMRNPLVIDFDGGAHRSMQSVLGTTVRVDSWADVQDVMNTMLNDYDTIVIDTVGSALDYMATYIIQQNPKMGTAKGTLTMQGWGELKAVFSAWFKKLNIAGKNVVMIAHHKEEREGDNVRKRPDIQGSSYGLVLKQADFVGFSYLNDASQRVIGFAPTGDYFGKDSARLGVVAVDNLDDNKQFGAQLIDRMIDAFGKQTDEHDIVMFMLAQYRAQLQECITPEALNELVAQLTEAPETVKTQMRALVSKHAKYHGWHYAKEEQLFMVQP
jgi:hypothetical protein